MSLVGQSKKKTKSSKKNFAGHLLTENSPFAVQEAYKSLRTNLIFSIPDNKCKSIVVTSSLQHEAKSTTAINLAIAFAQNQSKVLLIDCDLRLPTIASKLAIPEKPGLSNVLVGLRSMGETIYHMTNGFDVMPAGDVPPNPTELLGSQQMHRLMEALNEAYDYIILDTPPVCTVADATILAKFTSGAILVVRQNIATQDSVNEAVQKLEFAGSRIFGFVFSGVEDSKQKNYKKGYYGYGYGAAYGKSVQKAGNSKVK